MYGIFIDDNYKIFIWSVYWFLNKRFLIFNRQKLLFHNPVAAIFDVGSAANKESL